VLEDIGALALKGLTQSIVAYNVPLAASQPALRVTEWGPSFERAPHADLVITRGPKRENRARINHCQSVP